MEESGIVALACGWNGELTLQSSWSMMQSSWFQGSGPEDGNAEQVGQIALDEIDRLIQEAPRLLSQVKMSNVVLAFSVSDPARSRFRQRTPQHPEADGTGQRGAVASL